RAEAPLFDRRMALCQRSRRLLHRIEELETTGDEDRRIQLVDRAEEPFDLFGGIVGEMEAEPQQQGAGGQRGRRDLRQVVHEVGGSLTIALLRGEVGANELKVLVVFVDAYAFPVAH